MSRAVYRAPQTDRTVLAIPPLDQFTPLLDLNQQVLQSSSIQIDSQPLRQFRQQAVSEALQAARQYLTANGEPLSDEASAQLLVSGHQPEWFHLGVWVKNFVLHRLARRHGLTPLNLVVDNDTCKSTSLRLPVLPHPSDPRGVHLEGVPFDRYSGERSFEVRPILERDLLESFADRCEPLMRNWGYTPVLRQAWPDALRHAHQAENLGEVIARTRRCWERRLGCHNLEVPLSRLCETPAFSRFTRHLLSDLPRFHRIYNACVAENRRVNGIRSLNHPVPDLAQDGDWLEAPFWVIDPASERRGRLMVRSHQGKLEYRSGSLPVSGEVRLRSRALTTTLFARLALAEVFIHGIGGAKYDEVTDAIIERWLGMTPQRYLVLTGTLRLPLPPFRTDPARLRRTEREIRQLRWNPQLHLPADHPLVRQKAELVAAEPTERKARKLWFQALQAVTLAMRSELEREIAGRVEQQSAEAEQVEANRILQRRDYSWLLFPEGQLREFLVTQVNQATDAGGPVTSSS